MLFRTVFISALVAFAAFATGARCVSYVWTTAEDEAAYKDAKWHDTPLADGEYYFTPDYPVRERSLGFCGESDEAPLVQRGGLACRAFVLDVDVPGGSVTIHSTDALLDLFGPIDSEVEAASLIRATVGGFARYDGATATAGDAFLVRVMTVLDNCSPTAGDYAVVYRVAADGETKVVAEEARRTFTGGGAVCID